MTSSTARLPSELWNALAAPWNWPLTRFGQRRARRLRARRVRTSPSDAPGCEAERDRDRRQLAVVVDRLRSDDLRRVRERVERHDGPGVRGHRALPLAAVVVAALTRRTVVLRRLVSVLRSRRRRLEVEQRQRRRIGLELRRELEQHLVLVDRRVDRRDPARAVGVVERVLDLVGGDAERRRLVAIDLRR